MRRSLALAALFACAGCIGSEDVLASQLPSPADNPFNTGCSGAANGIALLSKLGHVYLMQPDTGEIDDRGIPECLSSLGGVSAASIDRSGMIWVANGGRTNLRGFDPITFECKELDVRMETTAMAFVYDPDSNAETLYALQGRELVGVDTATYSLTRMGSIGAWPKGTPTETLVGTSGNHLYMLSFADALSIASVDVSNAKLAPLGNARLRGGHLLMGGAAWGSEFLIGFSEGPRRLSITTLRTTPLVVNDFLATQTRVIAASTCTSAL